jgi:hypothetical protein
MSQSLINNVSNNSKTNQIVATNIISSNLNNQKISSKIPNRVNNQNPVYGNNQINNVFNENPNSNFTNLQSSFHMNMKDLQIKKLNQPFPPNKIMNNNINQEKNFNQNESLKMSLTNNNERNGLHKTHIPNPMYNKISPLNNAYDNNCYQQIFINNNNNIIGQPIKNNEYSNLEMSMDVIFCDDHLRRNINTNAKRYCLHCATFLCDDCVINSHDSHIKDCKSSIEEILMKNQGEIVMLRKNTMGLSNFDNSKHVNSNLEEFEKNMKNDLNNKLGMIKDIKNLLSEIEEIEKNNTKNTIEEIRNLFIQEIDGKNRNFNNDLKNSKIKLFKKF